jgi:hypothetical protein
MPGGHELLSTDPHGLADKIIEAGSTAEPPVAAPSVPDQGGESAMACPAMNGPMQQRITSPRVGRQE